MVRTATPPLVGYLLHGPLAPADAAALHDALGQHSPTLEPDPPDGCWLDLRGGRRGPSPARLGARVLATAVDFGSARSRLGIAPTPGVARLAAHHGPDGLTILDRDGVVPFLTPLAVAATGVGVDIADRLALVGLHTLGTIATLAHGALGDYLGPLGPALEALARGEDDRPLVPARPPLILAARRDLDFPLNDRSALAALVEYLLDPLLASLRHTGLGATRVEVRLTDTLARKATTSLRLHAPTADLAEVSRPLLAALASRGNAGDADDEGEGEGVTAVLVTITAPRPLAGVQASFFDVPQGQRGLLALGVEEARRRGEGRLGYLHPINPSHPLPERRYELVEGAVPANEHQAAS